MDDVAGEPGRYGAGWLEKGRSGVAVNTRNFAENGKSWIVDSNRQMVRSRRLDGYRYALRNP